MIFACLSQLITIFHLFSQNRGKARGGMSSNLINVDGEDGPFTSAAEVVMVSGFSFSVFLVISRAHVPLSSFRADCFLSSPSIASGTPDGSHRQNIRQQDGQAHRRAREGQRRTRNDAEVRKFCSVLLALCRIRSGAMAVDNYTLEFEFTTNLELQFLLST